MAAISVRNLPDEVHRALRARASKHGCSTEAEVRSILEMAIFPAKRIKLGDLMTSIAKEAGGLTDEEVESINNMRDKTPAEALRFE